MTKMDGSKMKARTVRASFKILKMTMVEFFTLKSSLGVLAGPGRLGFGASFRATAIASAGLG